MQQSASTTTASIPPKDISEIFGQNVYNKRSMKETLPKAIYKSLMRTIEKGEKLEPDVADAVATGMKNWAVKNGVTHYCHLFFPQNYGTTTAAKCESFLTVNHPIASLGKAMTSFSGSALVQGETDGSSLPSGGLRSTFEARGYTIWDCTSPAFISRTQKILYIPTAFMSYNGEALDQKTPLLRSMTSLGKEFERMASIFNTYASDKFDFPVGVKAFSTVGAEQEYFLIDKSVMQKRPDLVVCGRTLYGNEPSKGQSMSDHYFGPLNERISKFMLELDEKLWCLGIPAKTKHNEVAPSQYEIVPYFSTANLATDQNHILMERLQKIANRHNLSCLLHEKPFSKINGSGKHVNWSVQTTNGWNLFDPKPKGFIKTSKPNQPVDIEDNLPFLLSVAAIIQAVDNYQSILRWASATPGNDFRLGQNEAPPAIISCYLGENMTNVFDSIAKTYSGILSPMSPISPPTSPRSNPNQIPVEQVEISTSDKSRERSNSMRMSKKVKSLPEFMRDTSDRNRTSPFAFTGNKFEFRMVPSSGSISPPCLVLNTIFAESLSSILDMIVKEISDLKKEETDISSDMFCNAVKSVIGTVYKQHSRIIFNGDGYSEEWIKEAERRGLKNITNTVDAIAALQDPENIKLLEKQQVMSEVECRARFESNLEQYTKLIRIEAKVCYSMGKNSILPAAIKWESNLADAVMKIENLVKVLSNSQLNSGIEQEMLMKLNQNVQTFDKELNELQELIQKCSKFGDHGVKSNAFEDAVFMRDQIAGKMKKARTFGDKLLELLPKDMQPFPTIDELVIPNK